MVKNIKTALLIVAVLWIIFIGNFILFFTDLNSLGIRPRSIGGLIGILASPFLHANWEHLISNSVPLLILLITLITFYNKIWINVTLLTIILGGLAVWLFARPYTNHIGASGVIFAYIGFLIASGLFRRNFKAIAVGGIVLFLYGGTLLQGIIPNLPGVSWEGHLFGAISGILVAWIYKNPKETTLGIS